MPMQVVAWGMIGAGLAALAAGLWLARLRLAQAAGARRVLVLGPVFEAVALAIFAAEHFLAARDLMGIVPRWLPSALFWTYFVGAALLAAAISLIARKCMRWAALGLAALFLLIVATVSLPGLPGHGHERLYWSLTVRELAFAGGAMVLAGRQWPPGRWAGGLLAGTGRLWVACVCVFYAIEHFLSPLTMPGVPDVKTTPSWVPFPAAISYVIGAALLGAGFGLPFRRTRRIAAAAAGPALVLLTACFYVPILATEIHSPLAVEGVNYVGDTLLFAATVLLAGLEREAAG